MGYFEADGRWIADPDKIGGNTITKIIPPVQLTRHELAALSKPQHLKDIDSAFARINSLEKEIEELRGHLKNVIRAHNKVSLKVKRLSGEEVTEEEEAEFDPK